MRPLYLFFGWICVGLGIAGLALPMVPGTVFLILAAACFTRSSPRFEKWLLEHPRLGPNIVAWREHGVISPRAKLFAISGMLSSLVIMELTGAPFIAFAVALPAIAASAIFVLTRPSAIQR